MKTPAEIVGLLETLLEETSACAAGVGDRQAETDARAALDAALFPSELERGAFLEKDAVFLEELARSFARVQVRQRSPSHQDREKQRLEQEMFRTRADRLTSIATRIRRVLP